jgi:hypothetical protein
MTRFSKAFVVSLFSLAAVLSAEETKNGMSVTVSRKIVAQPPGAAAADGEWRRVQTLTLAAKSISIRNFPEGTVQWTVLLRHRDYGIATKHTGTEKLPPLRRLESVEIPIGVISVGMEQSIERDKIDYEVIVSHEGKETVRIASTSNFAALAEAARTPEREHFGFLGRREGRRRMGEDRPAGDGPKPAETGKEPAPPTPPAAAGAPTADAKMPPTPAAPPEPRKAAAEPPPAPAPSFDFFNLGGKTPPVAK